jgi:hypothetical protein
MSLVSSSAGCVVISYSNRITKSTPKNLVPAVKPGSSPVPSIRDVDSETRNRGQEFYASASRVHLVKSMGFLQPAQMCSLLNSSEKTSFSFPQFGHLQTKDFKFLRSCMPGQCMGVVMALLLCYELLSVRSLFFIVTTTLCQGFSGSAWSLTKLLSDLLAIVLGHLNTASQ